MQLMAKPLAESMLTQIYVAIWYLLGHNQLTPTPSPPYPHQCDSKDGKLYAAFGNTATKKKKKNDMLMNNIVTIHSYFLSLYVEFIY